MRERAPSPSRRSLLEEAVVATAMASLAKIAVADQADADLLAMGRELDALTAQEQAADAASDRLYEAAERSRPAPSAALLAYAYQGEPLFRPLGDGFTLNTDPYGYLLERARWWRDMGAASDHYPEASLIADLKTWEDGRRDLRRK